MFPKNTLLRYISIVMFVAVILPLHGWQLGGKNMVLAGTGEREKFFVTIYFASLYVPANLKGRSGEAIVAANEPMSVILKVDSSKLTRDRFMSATREGFQDVAALGYPAPERERFLAFFTGINIQVGDLIYLTYVPGSGLTASYQVKGTQSQRTLGTIPGLAFKKALFAIWLGPDPVQSGLKRGMLGQN